MHLKADAQLNLQILTGRVPCTPPPGPKHAGQTWEYASYLLG